MWIRSRILSLICGGWGFDNGDGRGFLILEVRSGPDDEGKRIIFHEEVDLGFIFILLI